MPPANITLEDDLLRQVEEAARAEGTSADALTAAAVRRELARRFWEQNKSQTARRRGTMTDEQVDDIVDRAIQDRRAGKH